ncbi:MAG TPA: hypothetical protein VJY35_05985 [Candidatus Eisenbacteria bacterium]|nr:hypothetical protein [Candidatus Eisenbacteria bacterium]
MEHPSRTVPDRRRFLKTLGLAGLSSTLVPRALALAQSATPPAGATPAKPDSVAAPAPPAEISEDARSLAEIVRRRYGKHLTPDQMEAITRELDGRVQAGKRLRESKLTNADEPDVTFHA